MNTSGIEQSIVGTLLRNPDQATRHEINPEYFTVIEYRRIYSAIVAIISSGSEVDVFAVHERVRDCCDLDVVARLMAHAVGAVENLASRVETLRREYHRRSGVEMLRVGAKTLADSENPSAVAGILANDLVSLFAETRRKSFTAAQCVTQVVDYIAEVQQARHEGRSVGVPTGFRRLDNHFGGMHKSDLVIVAGRPAMGKTAFSLCVGYNAARAGMRVGFVSAEMSAVQIGQRLMSLISGIPADRLRNGNLSESDYPRLIASANVIKSLPLHIADMPAASIPDIAIQVRAWQMMEGLDLVIVDYLQRLNLGRRAENRTLEVGLMAQELKTLARTSEIPVIALAQLNRDLERRQDKRPNMGDLRDSGMIEQEADQIMMLYRESVYNDTADPNMAEILIEKNRHGPTGMCPAKVNMETMHWTNADIDEEIYRYA